MRRRGQEESGLSVSQVAVKTCSICGELRAIEFFARGRAQCMPCRKNYERQYRQANRQHIAILQLRWEKANREKRAKRARKPNNVNKEKHNEYMRKYRAANLEKCNEYMRKYRAANLEKCRALGRKSYAANREKRAERKREYKATLPDAYVAEKIIRNTTLTRADIPPELLEAKRLQLKLKRLAREEMK